MYSYIKDSEYANLGSDNKIKHNKNCVWKLDIINIVQNRSSYALSNYAVFNDVQAYVRNKQNIKYYVGFLL